MFSFFQGVAKRHEAPLKKSMEFKLQLAALVRSKIEGGKLKLELHAFFRSFRAAPTRHGGPLIKIIIRIAIDFLPIVA